MRSACVLLSGSSETKLLSIIATLQPLISLFKNVAPADVKVVSCNIVTISCIVEITKMAMCRPLCSHCNMSMSIVWMWMSNVEDTDVDAHFTHALTVMLTLTLILTPSMMLNPVSYTHLTLPTIYSV